MRGDAEFAMQCTAGNHTHGVLIKRVLRIIGEDAQPQHVGDKQGIIRIIGQGQAALEDAKTAIALGK